MPRTSTRGREQVARRAGHCCEYCRSQEKFSHDDFAVEHIKPRVAGGADTLNNLAFSCQGCNNRKFTATTALDPATGEDAPLFHPRRQTWVDHFEWTDNYTQVNGLTATGRATIEKLQLNRPRLVNLRRVLWQAGAHPPLLSPKHKPNGDMHPT